MGMFIPGRGIRRVAGVMNKTERAWADLLDARRYQGEVLGWMFDAVQLRLAANTFYTPDFLVQLADGSIEVHEVKGFWQEDARVKIKVAAGMYPFLFRAVTRAKGKRGCWNEEVIAVAGKELRA